MAISSAKHQASQALREIIAAARKYIRAEDAIMEEFRRDSPTAPTHENCIESGKRKDIANDEDR